MNTEKTKLEFGRAIPRDIKITPSDNKGFIVKCGCGTFAFSNKDDMLVAMKEFIGDPETVEKRYNDSNVGCPVDETDQDLPQSNRRDESRTGVVRGIGTPNTNIPVHESDDCCNEPQCETSG